MAVRDILLLGNPLLRRISEEVTDLSSVETREIITDLASTLTDFRDRQGFGRAIAAPQIGRHRRILFVNMNDGIFGPAPLINPEIVNASSEMMDLWDDCFSFPDLMVRVSRHVEVGVRYTDEHGVIKTVTASGDLSELLQHEIDHLYGILAIDRAIDKHSFALRSEVAGR